VNNKPAIILVEDDASVLRALRRVLEFSGFEVRAFSNPGMLQATGVPDSNACLIFDVHLSQMTGVELYQELAAAGSTLPLILITGYVDDATRAMTESVKAVAVLTKPFDSTLSPTMI
jgi:FixJ family two-component response regulator